MENETEISTPEEIVADDTSVEVEPVEDTDTSITEPEPQELSAETETKAAESTQQETLYAGKYKSVEELVKGYDEAQKYVTKASELEKKYNELLEKQAQEAENAELKRLEQAQLRGFKTVEQQEIADKVQFAEFQYYWNNLNTLHPEHVDTVQQCLNAYYQSGNRAYLEEAKRYYSSDFIENVALAKVQMEQKLTNEFETQRNERLNAESQKLAEVLRTDFAEFLTDLDTNSGKAQALKMFCEVGSINSKEDMQVFSDIYNQIAKFEREQAIKEYEVAKSINEIKSKAIIESAPSNDPPKEGLKEVYSEDEVYKMAPEEFDKLYSKYGEEFTKRIR